MFRLVSKQSFKPMGVHYRLQVRRAISSTTPRCNTDDDSNGQSTGSADAGSQKEMKSEMNAKFDKMDAKIDANFDKLNTKMDREYDKRMYCKFDRLLYAIIGSFATVLSTGGFASYLTWKKQ